MAQGTDRTRPRPHDWQWLLPAGGPRPGPPDPDRFRSPAATAGRGLVGTGAVLLLFALYQLWGTGLVEAQAQRALARQLDLPAEAVGGRPTGGGSGRAGGAVGATLAVADPATVERTTPIAPPAAPPTPANPSSPPAAPLTPAAQLTAPRLTPAPPPTEGEAIGRITLPTIGVEKTIAQGVRRETLRSGPGHYPSSALPGQRGNVAIAGHRTTHGAPFADLDRLNAADEILVDTQSGRFTYRVLGQPNDDGSLAGHRIVDPSAVEVIADHGDDRLTLTACHPKFSARQRIVVSAVLVAGPPTGQPSIGSTGQAVIDGGSTTGGVIDGGVVTGASSVPAPGRGSGDAPTTGHPVRSTDGYEAAAVPRPALPAAAGEADRAGGSADGLGDSLGWQGEEAEPTLLWVVVTVLTLFVAWVIGRFWPTRLVYPAAGPVVAVPLFVCFFHLERLLPAY